MQSPKGITIYDIAKEAGVSPATVSRVLTNSPGVRPEKRERIQALIAKHNFTPNVMAKSLSETRRRTVGMVCADVRNPYYASLFVECEHAAYDRGYTLMLNNTLAREELEIVFLEKGNRHVVRHRARRRGLARRIHLFLNLDLGMQEG